MFYIIGITAGKQWYEKGSGVTALCLPHDPESANADFLSSVGDNLFAFIWGSEYQFGYRHVSTNDDAPCAVCQVQSTSTLMVPAKRSCPSGWSMEYNGILVAGASDEFAFEYICIDENPEYFEGTRGHNDNGLTLHPVRARCGSLPCPPYTENQFIPCVVCSH